jgi:pyrimidine operon attenuation protein/uracil phosphoribosyltransferase
LPESNQQILDSRKIKRALTRIAHEILEQNVDIKSLAIIGIITRGAHLARRIAAIIKDIEGVEVPVGLMDISLYRDDVHSKLDQPIVQRTDILFSVSDKNIILIDDVLFTGRTVRAALDQIVDFGRPRTIQLAVLVDRGHRQLPIKADYVGANIPTAVDDKVVLEVTEKEGQDQVYIVSGYGASTKKKSAPKKKKPRTSGRKK